MKSRDTDTESEDTTPGRDSWRSARGRETVLLTTPRTRGQGKRQMEQGGGTTKRPRMESSSSERRDESESRSGGTRDRPGRCRRTAEHGFRMVDGWSGNPEGCAGSHHSLCPPCSPLWFLAWGQWMSPAVTTMDAK